MREPGRDAAGAGRAGLLACAFGGGGRVKRGSGFMFKALVLAAAAAIVAPAAAQTNGALSGSMQTVSIADAAAMLGELGVASKAQAAGAGQSPLLLAASCFPSPFRVSYEAHQ